MAGAYRAIGKFIYEDGLVAEVDRARRRNYREQAVSGVCW